ncbi:MAG TPA: SAM-dependent chlorinase/fluorinase, partial [Tepidisphaeraceae bacterium]|nr:SAM-dependent chlorinase/fluorinase [Tepidisphaeraceae bacterium]
LDIAPAREGAAAGRVIHIDHFGNCTTNLLAERLPPTVRMVQAGQHAIGRLRRAYADVNPGEPVALMGSSGLLEIAVNQGSAAQTLKLNVGSRVDLRMS